MTREPLQAAASPLPFYSGPLTPSAFRVSPQLGLTHTCPVGSPAPRLVSGRRRLLDAQCLAEGIERSQRQADQRTGTALVHRGQGRRGRAPRTQARSEPGTEVLAVGRSRLGAATWEQVGSVPGQVTGLHCLKREDGCLSRSSGRGRCRHDRTARRARLDRGRYPPLLTGLNSAGVDADTSYDQTNGPGPPALWQCRRCCPARPSEPVPPLGWYRTQQARAGPRGRRRPSRLRAMDTCRLASPICEEPPEPSSTNRKGQVPHEKTGFS